MTEDDRRVLTSIEQLEVELRGAEGRLQAAQLASDVAELDALLDERLVATLLPSTAPFGKVDDLAAHRSGGLRITELVEEDLAVLVVGRTGVTRLLATIGGTQDGVAFGGRALYTRTWHHDDEHGWRVLAAHISPI